MLSAQLIVVSSHSVWEKEGFRPLLQMCMLPCYMGERLFHKYTALWGSHRLFCSTKTSFLSDQRYQI